MRVEFLSRLYIARLLNLPTLEIVRAQKESCRQRCAACIVDRDCAAPGVGRLALELEVAQLDAILDWIDRCELDPTRGYLMKSKLLIVVLLALLLIGLLPVSAQTSQSLTVFAASSLTDAFSEIATAFEAANPGVEVIFNFGGSSTLATQLSNGAPADVFASANNSQMTNAAESRAHRLDAAPRTFVKNRLVLIVPADNPANIQSLHDLANPGVKLVLAAPAVPVRDYTDAMLEKLAADPGYGDAYQDRLSGERRL